MTVPESESAMTADGCPGTTDPGTADPGTTDPGTTDPGTADPGTADPGTAELQLGNVIDEENKPGWHSRGYLPHCDVEGLIQHISFHLADSLPKSALDRLESSIEEMPDDEKKRQRRQRYETLLDAGHGSCVLGKPEAAKIVEGALLHFDGARYRLLAWVIMPNHVHALIEPLPGFSVGRLVQSLKSFTARRINLLVADGLKRQECRAGARRSQDYRSWDYRSRDGRSRALWQRDYWDRYIRNERHLLTAIRYIEENPVASGLAGAAEEWPWGSARRRR